MLQNPKMLLKSLKIHITKWKWISILTQICISHTKNTLVQHYIENLILFSRNVSKTFFFLLYIYIYSIILFSFDVWDIILWIMIICIYYNIIELYNRHLRMKRFYSYVSLLKWFGKQILNQNKIYFCISGDLI